MVSNLRTLDFQQIYGFVAVVRHGGISAAARELGLAKSAVSKHVSQLEDVLGVKLLLRASRRVSLTREGEQLRARLESLLAEGQRLLEQAGEAQDRPEGLVRIAATPDFGVVLAEHFFPIVLERHPALSLAIEPAYAVADLQDPAFDLAFRIGQIRDERLVARELGTFRRMLVASPAYLRARPVQRTSELERRDCLIFSGNRTDSEWSLVRDGSAEEIVVRVHGHIAVKSFRILASLAERGAGISFVPDFLVRDALSLGRLARCLPDWASPPTPVYLSYRVGTDKIRRCRAVMDLALEHVPRLLAARSHRNKARASPHEAARRRRA